MALEPGGYSEKLGNRYEGRWVVKQLLRLLYEEIRSVTLEPIGDDEKGVDLIVERNDGVKQYQQCKARNKSKESWSVADLNARGILGAMRFQLDRNADYEFGLVSGVSATVFGDICGSARKSNEDPEDFYKYQIHGIGESRDKPFREFCQYLELDYEKKEDRAKAFGYLYRIHIIPWDDGQSCNEDLLSWSSMLINGEPKAVIACLADFAQDNLRKRLVANDIWAHLSKSGYTPRKLEHDNRVVPAVEDLQQRFEDSIAPGLVADTLIPRNETQELLKAIDENVLVILHGVKGYGKSGVLYELTQILKEQNRHYIPIRLDRQEPRNNARQFGFDMGLPESPTLCLKSLSNSQTSVLILDQLDALRWTSSHSANSLDVCKDMVREIIHLRRMGIQLSVILSCRTFDLKHDREIKNWLGSQNSGFQHEKICVGLLPEKDVGNIITASGDSLANMTKKQRQILSSPQHLAMWVCIRRQKEVPDFQSSTQLMREFWNSCYRELAMSGVSGADADSVLDSLVNYMEQNDKLSAPVRLISNRQTVLTELQTHGIIHCDSNRVTFCHQSYLDFRIADRLFREVDQGEGDIKDWLGEKESQSLFRREQLRQILLLLCDESPNEFLNNVKILLGSDQIRFHLKHLVLEVVGQIEEPNESLCDYLLELFVDDYWEANVRETVFLGHPQYVQLLIDRGLASMLLDSDDEEKRGFMFWLLRSVADNIPDEVSIVLEPYAEKDGDWPRWVLSSICWHVQNDSDRMFELRLKLARIGIVQEYPEWDKIVEKNPSWAFRLIEVVLSTWDSPVLSENSLTNKGRSRVEQWQPEQHQAIKTAAQYNPGQVWDLLMPHIERLTAVESDKYYDLHDWRNDSQRDLDNDRASISRGVVKLVCEAGKVLADKETDKLIERTSNYINSISPVTQEIIMASYASLPAEHADLAIRYLLSETSRLEIGSGYNEIKWKPAIKLIEAQSPFCSEEVFRELEKVITNYHSPDEKGDSKYYIPLWKEGCFIRHWGRAQHFLLPALCRERRAKRTSDLIRVLKRKFESYSKDRFLSRSTGTGGIVGSPLPHGRLHEISDNAWLGIINNKSISEHGIHFRMKQIGPDRVAVSAITHFADDLRFVSKKYPERFAQLALRFPEDVHPSYIAAILDGVKTTEPENISDSEKTLWKPVDVKTIESIIEKFLLDDNQSRQVAHDFCWLIKHRSNENWSDKTIDRLLDYAINHPDLEPGKLNMRCDISSDEATVDDLVQNAINCIRGIAGLAIGALLWKHPDLLEKLQPGLEHLVNDHHPAVRVAALEACMPVLNIKKDYAVDLFVRACKDDLRIAACRYAVEYFNYCMTTHDEKLAPIIIQMFNSDNEEVAEEGAVEVCARWLFYGMFEDQLAMCRSGKLVYRKGIAKVASNHLAKVEYTEKCKNLLLPLFEDDEKDVRQKAGHVFYNKTEILDLPDIQSFAQSYITSKAFRDDPTGIILTFDNYPGSLVPYANLVLAICEQFVGPLAELSHGLSGRLGHDASMVSSLVLRLYEQSKESNADIMNRCLDMWDAMFEKRIGGTRETIKEI